MLPEVCRFLLGLLPFLQTTRAALVVRVDSALIQADPGSNAILPCHVSDTSGPLELQRLAVIWRINEKVIAMYEDKFEAKRPGAKIAVEKLQEGNATLFLPHVQDTDNGVYSCFVIHVPNSGEAKVELRVEAPPQLGHGPTKIQVGKPNNVTCTASGFYPGNISVTWLQDGKIVKGPEWPIARRNEDDGLFSAESTLEFTPRSVGVSAAISCQVNHTAITEPLRKDFQLKVYAQPVLEVITQPPGEEFYAAICQVSSFYPREIHVQWLQNGMLQPLFETQPQTMANGTFSIQSIVVLQKMGVKVNCTCQVQHESLDTPLKKEIFWLPKELRALESSASFSPWLLGVIAFIFGVAAGIGGTAIYFKNKAKHTEAPGEKSEGLLRNPNEEGDLDTSDLKTVKDDAGPGSSRGHLEEDEIEWYQNRSKAKTEELHDISVSML